MPVARSSSKMIGDPDLGLRLYLRILHHCKLVQNMPSECQSNVCCDENMKSHVHHGERGSLNL